MKTALISFVLILALGVPDLAVQAMAIAVMTVGVLIKDKVTQ